VDLDGCLQFICGTVEVWERPASRGLRCCLQDIKFNVHAHPTLSEVLDELFKGAHVAAGPSKVPPPPPYTHTMKEDTAGHFC
jgi:hypothetical protein